MLFNPLDERSRRCLDTTFGFFPRFSQERCRFGNQSQHSITDRLPQLIDGIDSLSFDVEIVGTSEVEELRVERFEMSFVRGEEVDEGRDEIVVARDGEQTGRCFDLVSKGRRQLGEALR